MTLAIPKASTYVSRFSFVLCGLQEKIPRQQLEKMVTESAVNQFIEKKCVLSIFTPHTILPGCSDASYHMPLAP